MVQVSDLRNISHNANPNYFNLFYFRQRLEKSYKLCSICEKTVENTLKLKGNLYAKTCDRKYYEKEEETAYFLVRINSPVRFVNYINTAF